MGDVQGLYMSLVVVCSGRLFALIPSATPEDIPKM